MNSMAQNDAKAAAARIWEYIDVVLSNERLLHELGFAGRAAVEQVAIVLRAGDRLHPARGFDFLGPDWRSRDENDVFRLLDERNALVQNILGEFLEELEVEGYQAALEQAQSASKYVVLFASRSQSETEKSFREMYAVGLGGNEISSDLIEKRADSLVVAYHEHISYYLTDESGDTIC